MKVQDETCHKWRLEGGRISGGEASAETAFIIEPFHTRDLKIWVLTKTEVFFFNSLNLGVAAIYARNKKPTKKTTLH